MYFTEGVIEEYKAQKRLARKHGYIALIGIGWTFIVPCLISLGVSIWSLSFTESPYLLIAYIFPTFGMMGSLACLIFGYAGSYRHKKTLKRIRALEEEYPGIREAAYGDIPLAEIESEPY